MPSACPGRARYFGWWFCWDRANLGEAYWVVVLPCRMHCDKKISNAILCGLMTRSAKSSSADLKSTRGWEPPAFKKLAIGSETKFFIENCGSAKSEACDSQHSTLKHPQPPVAPNAKLGFSFEMAFPLSARTNN